MALAHSSQKLQLLNAKYKYDTPGAVKPSDIDEITRKIYEDLVNARPYKEYIATLTQTGTDAPTATVTTNEFEGEIIFSRISVGIYSGTLAGAFTDGKTSFGPTPLTVKNGGGGWTQMQPYVLGGTEDSFYFNAYSLRSGNVGNNTTELLEDGIIYNVPISIRVGI